MSPEQTGPRTIAAAAGRIFRSPVWAFVLIFLLSFAVRAALLASLAESRENFYRLGSGIEDRVALSLLRTGGFADPYLIPSGPTAHPPPLWPGVLVRDLGEAEYMRRARSEAIEWIRTHPAESLRLTLMRVVHFWCGPLRLPWLAALTSAVTVLALLGLRRILPALDGSGRAALLIPLATFPLVYYVVSYQAHYPAPLAWLLLLLASYESRAGSSAGPFL